MFCEVSNKTHREQFGNLDLDCHLAPAEADQVPKAPESRLSYLTPTGDNLDTGQPRDFPAVINEVCLHVKVSPCCFFFVTSQNVAISQPGHGVFACLCMAPEDPGSESRWKWRAGESRFPLENFRPFHPLLPPKKVKCQSCWAWLPLQVASF